MKIFGIDVQSNALYAGLTTIVIAFIVITPLCGSFFGCGCTWPWAGLDRSCSIHNVLTVHGCPWCTSLLAGVGSVFLSIGFGFVAAVIPKIRYKDKPKKLGYDYLFRVVDGMAVFLVVATLLAGLSALWLGYPGFIFEG